MLRHTGQATQVKNVCALFQVQDKTKAKLYKSAAWYVIRET
jgi:hypothetical protein